MGDATITIDVRNSDYTALPHNAPLIPNTPNPNSKSYSYQYAGGTDGQGNVSEIIGQGAATITVNLVCAAQYTVTDIQFDNASHPQLSYNIAAGGRTVTLTDLDTAAEDDYYKLIISDSGNGGCQFQCDPRVTNRT